MNFRPSLRFLALVVLAGSVPVQLASAAEPLKPDRAESPARAFLKLMDRPRVPLQSIEKTLPETNGLAKIHFTFATEAGQRVPGLLVKQPALEGRRPVVIALHGTGSNKESQTALLEELAEAGFVAIAMDARYHGERMKSGSGASAYNDAILRAYRTGEEHPFLYDTVWDVMRLIDYLETRRDVDPKRIGLIGFSKGGMEGYLAAAVDPRIATVVPCIGVQSFRWALDHNAWQSRIGTIQAAVKGAADEAGVKAIDAKFIRHFYDRVVPGIYGQFDGPAMLPLIAPRPLLVINGDSDDRTPLAGVSECAAAARAAYEAAEAPEKFVLYIQENTGHKVTRDAQQAAIQWLVKWLAP